MTDASPITVEIWSDIACPWCFIGKRKFEQGRATFEAAGGVPVTVEYRSFELSPDTPADFTGSTTEFLAKHKNIPVDQVAQMLQHVSGIASEVGLHYDFDSVVHVNTLRAHQVLHVAKAAGKQLEVTEAMFSAYFEQGKDLSDANVLADIAASAGVDRQQVLDALASQSFLPDVQEDIAQAQRYGIRGVPFAVIDGRYGISGAQPAEVFAQALAQAAQDRVAGQEA